MKIKSHLTKILCTFSLLALIISQQLNTKTKNQVQAIPTDFIIAQPQTDYKTYSISNRFSIQVPQNWIAEENESSITFWSSRNNNKNLIKTTAYLLPQTFDEAVPSANKRTFEGPTLMTVTKRGNLTIDNKPAVRIWLVSPDAGFHFPNEINSYIRYSKNTTALIVSWYYAENPKAVDIIQRIHESFCSLQ